MCWHALMFKKHILFQILYIIVVPLCTASLKCVIFYNAPLSDKHSLLWLTKWHRALWLAEHHKPRWKCNSLTQDSAFKFRRKRHILYLSHTQLYDQQWNLCSAFNPSKCTHTWSSGQLTLRHRGAVGGSVTCSRLSPQSWTIPAGADIRTHKVRHSIH